jgi:hypothetical protein
LHAIFNLLPAAANMRDREVDFVPEILGLLTCRRGQRQACNGLPMQKLFEKFSICRFDAAVKLSYLLPDGL